MAGDGAHGSQELGATGVAAHGLGRAAGQGAAVLAASSLAMRVLNFVAQVVVGTILFDEDFGVFAIANSVAAFVLILQDGGLQTLLVQRGEAAYDDLEGPAFWLGLTYNLLAGALLAVLAPLLAALYREPALAPMLWFIAATIPLNSLSAVSLARLRMDMRFGPLSAIEVLQGVVRYGGMMAGAAAGLGSIAFVAPLPIIAVLTGIAAAIVTRRAPWKRPAEMNRWPGLLTASAWLIASSLAGSALYLGSHMALGLTATTALVGVYFFGYSFIQQSGHLVISNAERVLLPVFSRMRDDPERLRSVTVRTLRGVAILSFCVSVVFGALFAPIENLFWRGKWAVAGGVVRIMAIAFPIFIIHVVARCVVNAQGRFPAHALSVGLAGAVLMGVAAGAGSLATDSTSVGWIIGGGMAVVSLGYLAWGVRDLRLGPMELARRIAPATACAVAALMAGILAERLALGAVAGGCDPLSRSLGVRLVANGVRLASAGAACALVLVTSLRLFVPAGLVECLEVLPDRIARPARAWLRL